LAEISSCCHSHLIDHFSQKNKARQTKKKKKKKSLEVLGALSDHCTSSFPPLLQPHHEVAVAGFSL
jgi:hypothetical protein